MFENALLYVDCNATMPMSRAHVAQVMEELLVFDGNPSSIHESGRNAKVALERARAAVAKGFGCLDSELIFLSGATEANNMILQGIVLRERASGARELPHVLVSSIEHPSVLESAKILAERGFCKVELVPVREDGTVEVETLVDMIRSNTALVAVMHANNEVGSVSEVERLAAACKAKKPDLHFHTDAVQSFGKFDLRGFAGGAIDSAAVSGHKVGSFKGIGALFLKSGKSLARFVVGGGQERGRRAGTENIPGIISFGLRCEALLGGKENWHGAAAARDALEKELQTFQGVVFHGATEHRLPNTSHFHVEGIAGDDLLLNLDLAGVQAASGSACSSGVARPSHVLTAMGYDDWVASNSLRISFLMDADEDAAMRVAKSLSDTLQRLANSRK